jgi:hypothetical protein
MLLKREKLVDTNQSKSYNNNTFKMIIVHHHQCAIAAFNAGHNYIFPTVENSSDSVVG